MHYKDIDYIAFEGGGGRGIVYLGAVRALEKAGKLPLSKTKRDQDEDCLLLQGVAGASAGAITCYFLALGMSADDILLKTREISRETKKPEFYSFYDDAQPALYKGVAYNERLKANVPCYIVDVPKVDREDISYIDSGREYVDEALAKRVAADRYALYNWVYPLSPIKTLMRLFAVRRGALRKAARSNQVAEKLAEKPGDLNKYLYSLLFDRGLFSGINLRTYLHKLTVEMLSAKFGVQISLEQASTLTFAQFFEKTSNDLRIAGTNVTKGVPVYFSRFLTPDFPIVDCICMSMSIPFAFKPTLSHAWARCEPGKPRYERDSAHNERYRGFFNDGGILNNLPIHAFDFLGDDDNYTTKVVELNKKMFGIRCTGKSPTDPLEDARFPYDPNYLCYLDEVNKTNERLPRRKRKAPITPEKVKTLEVENPFRVVMDLTGPLDVFSPLVHFGGRLFNSLMYASEDGQIRSEKERAQTMELYSYDVGLFDFTISDYLSDFVQSRAAIKVGATLEIPKNLIRELVLERYYQGKPDVSVDVYIEQTYERLRPK